MEKRAIQVHLFLLQMSPSKR